MSLTIRIPDMTSSTYFILLSLMRITRWRHFRRCWMMIVVRGISSTYPQAITPSGYGGGEGGGMVAAEAEARQRGPKIAGGGGA